MKTKEARCGKNLGNIFFFAVLAFVIVITLSSNASAKEFVIQNESVNMFVVNGTSGNIILNPNFGKIGIATTSPTDTLTLIGSLVTLGSLNATFINATQIRMGTDLVQVESPAFKRANITDFLGVGNESILKQSNISLFITNFQLSNISNNTLKLGENVSIALWNTTFGNKTYYYTRDANATVIVGMINLSDRNATELLTVKGNVSIGDDLVVGKSESARVFNLSASTGLLKIAGDFYANAIYLVGSLVQVEAPAFKRGNITDFLGVGNESILKQSNISNIRESLWNRANMTDFIGDNRSIIRTENLTNISIVNLTVVNLDLGWTNLSHYPSACPAGQFVTQVGDTLTCAAESADVNATGPWNSTNTNVYLNDSSYLVGIGTVKPDNKLTISADELTANAILHINASDNFNNSVINVLTLDHVLKSPLNATQHGVSILFRGTDNASQLSLIGNISAVLYNATNGSQLSAITFSTRGADTGDGSFGHLTERLRIDGGGRVGVNTTTPSSTFQVAGTANITQGTTSFRVTSDNNIVIHLE